MREIVLRIPHPNLLVFYTDKEVGWKESFVHLFIKVGKNYGHSKYQLSVTSHRIKCLFKRSYKFLVYLRKEQNPIAARWALEAGGYKIIGEEQDSKSGRLRIWFIDPRRPTTEDQTFNVWE